MLSILPARGPGTQHPRMRTPLAWEGNDAPSPVLSRKVRSMPFEIVSWPGFLVAVLAAVIAAVVIAAVAAVPVRLLSRRRGWDARHVGRVRRPFRLLLVIVGLRLAVQLSFPEREWMPVVDHVFRILIIAGSAWLVAGIMSFAFEAVLARYPIDVADNRVARRVRTQVSMLRRVGYVVIAVLAVGAILLTFPGVEAVGASVLASAGLLSVVAGLAAQSTLSNVFAGLQLAFSDAIRVDDVVIAEEEWGRIEEITLTYVVMRLWDDRRLVLPSTYFTSTPFQNWTRHESQLLGAVELDLDWRVDLHGLRDRLDELLDASELWDGRTKVLQVTDAVGGLVRVRVLLTAADAGALFDLRCQVREGLVQWVTAHDPDAMPVQRVELAREGADGAAARAAPHVPRTEGLFTGSPEAEQRGATFTSSIPVLRLDPDARLQ